MGGEEGVERGARPPRLLDQVRSAIRTRHYSLRTEAAYVGWIRRFILYHGKRHPRELGEASIADFLTHLAVEGLVSQSQALNALVFLHQEVLGVPLADLSSIVRRKRSACLPVVLTPGEVSRLLEGLRLRVEDIALERGKARDSSSEWRGPC